MPRRFILICTVLFAGTVVVPVFSRGAPAAPATSPASWVYPETTDRQLGAEAKLREPVAHLRFDKIAFDKAIDQLREISKANLFLAWPALESAGIERTRLVELDLRDVPLAGVLDRLCDSLSNPTSRVGYTLDDGVIVIGTEDYLERYRTIRIYDLRGLMEADIAWRNALPGQPPLTYMNEVEDIAKLLSDLLPPTSWTEGNGQISTVKELSGRLIVTQTWRNHREIERVLAILRQPGGRERLQATTRPAGPTTAPSK